ncbi:MAG TPA: NADP-dependent malic enzyme [Longimicrobiales bacterium]|nr:NADP-dependent malic enzyme [Longimicrobiales bacterium]
MSDDRKRAALDYHSQGRPGKIAVVPTKPVGTQWDLSLAYTPGVAEPCRLIAADPEESFKYTARGNLVGVVSNGTAVLGLGNLGALAGKPVMEGKGVLFKRFADIDVFDIEVDSEDPAEIIRFCEMLSPTLGGINLEDIKAPECFEIEEALKERLDIPVFHDDQHGTAIISGAALVNALEVVEKDIGEVKIVFSGAGASAIATADHYIRLGAKREHIFLCDSKGLITAGRTEGMNKYKARYAQAVEGPHTLADVLAGADVFVGLSVAGQVTGAMVKTMAARPVIFALANPDPEILPDEVFAVRDDAIMATGRSDFANQVNNVLGFPFIFRGALDVRARSITDNMKLAATRALAALAKEDVPESVAHAYGDEAFRFGPRYLIPKPFDHRVLLWVAPAVARAAVEDGVARLELDPEEYRTRLEARLGRRREVMRDIMLMAQRDPRRIVYPEGEDDRIIRAVAQARNEGIVQPVLLGRPERIRKRAEELHVDLTGVEVVDARGDEDCGNRYAQRFYERRQRKGITLAEACERLREPTYYGYMMVAEGDADGAIAGIDSHYPETIRPALEAVGVDPAVKHVAGLYMMVLQQDLMFFADTTVNIDPDAETLAEIAQLSADFVARLGIEPRVAMLSFSNFGSARHPKAETVRRATALVKKARPDLKVDGEMQADTAVVEEILGQRYPFSTLGAPANVLIFPDLNAANIAYKLMGRLGGAEAIGPILLGMNRPVHVLQRGGEAADVVNLTALAVVDAQRRDPAGGRTR